MQDLEHFQQLTARSNLWTTIDDLLALCDAGDFWDEAWLTKTTDVAKKSIIRRLIRQVKDEDKWPTWASIVITDPEGTQQRLYKQEVLFDVDDYRQTVSYWVGATQYSMKMAEGYRDHAVKRYGVQLELPWE